MRVSDAQREQCFAILREHFARGRLSTEELEERLGRAQAAVEWRELRALTRDLPRRSPGRRLEAAHRLALRAHAGAYVAGNAALTGVWAAAGADDAFWPGFVLAPT